MDISWLEDIEAWLTPEEKELPKESRLAIQSSQIVAFLPFPLLLCDKHFKIIGANHAFKRLFFQHHKELEGKSLSKVLGIAAENINGQFLAQRNPKTLEQTFRKVGRKVFHIFSWTLSVKERAEVLLLFQDVTTDKDLEQKIVSARRELIYIFDGIDYPIIMIDKDFKIRRINNIMLKTCRAKNYQESIGKTCFWKLHGLRQVCPTCTARETFASGLKTTRMGLLEKRPDAENYGYQINCYPLKDQSGNVTGIVESYHDVSEIMRIKEKLVESERSRIIESLAAGIAHEVRNPLAVIQSNAQYCLHSVDKNEDLEESMTAILKSAAEANRVIQGLLDFARPQEVHFEHQSLKPILEEGLSLIRMRARQQHVRLRTSIPRRLRHLVLDRKRLLQAIINFAFNALDVMPDGGILRVSARPNPKEQMMQIIIEDTGKGVPAELIPKIFQPFYSTKKEGVGLGLSIAEGIVRSHGGKVLFQSWEGKGSRAQLLLPYHRELQNSLSNTASSDT